MFAKGSASWQRHGAFRSIVAFIFLGSLVSTALATEDTDGPPANWDTSYLTGQLGTSDWQIYYQGEWGFDFRSDGGETEDYCNVDDPSNEDCPTPPTIEYCGNPDYETDDCGNVTNYCVGIIKYKTKVADFAIDTSPAPSLGDCPGGTYTNPAEEWAFAYYATQKPGGVNCETLLNGEGDPLGRPAVLWLHGGGDRGSFAQAAIVAAALGYLQNPPFVLSISGPGAGYECEVDTGTNPDTCDADAWTPECTLPMYNPASGTSAKDDDQFSVGVEPWDWNCAFEPEFDGNGSTDVEPDLHVGWAYATSAMRAINLIKRKIGEGVDTSGMDPPDGDALFITNNDDLLVAGISYGGVTALNVANVDLGADFNPSGIIAWHASGAWDEAWNVEGSWNTFSNVRGGANDTDDPAEYEYDPEYSLDCSSGSLEDFEKYACEMQKYLDPASTEWETPNGSMTAQAITAPILLVSGAQDEAFNVRGFQTTFDRLTARDTNSKGVYRALVHESDHGYYFNIIDSGTVPGARDYETYEMLYKEFDLAGIQDQKYNFYSINSELWSMRRFYQGILDGSGMDDYVTAPSKFEIRYIENFGWARYKAYVCWPLLAPDPQAVTFHYTMDDFFHILPACESEADTTTTGYYKIEDQNEYDYDAGCYVSNDWVDKCVSPNDPDRDIQEDGPMVGRSCQVLDACPTKELGITVRECQVFNLELDDALTQPDRVSVWANLHYAFSTTTTTTVTTSGSTTTTTFPDNGNSYLIVSSSEIQTFDNVAASPPDLTSDITIVDPCIRGRLCYDAPGGFDQLSAAIGGGGEPSSMFSLAGECQSMTISESFQITDGQLVDYSGYDVVIADGVTITATGRSMIKTDCGFGLSQGANIISGNERIAEIAIMASDIDIRGSIDTSSADNGGRVTLNSNGSIAISGAIKTSGESANSYPGRIEVRSQGDIEYTGTIEATAGHIGGQVLLRSLGRIYVAGSVDLSGNTPQTTGGVLRVSATQTILVDDEVDLTVSSGPEKKGLIQLRNCNGNFELPAEWNPAELFVDDCTREPEDSESRRRSR